MRSLKKKKLQSTIPHNHLFYFHHSLPYLLARNVPYSKEKTYPKIFGRTYGKKEWEKQTFKKHNDHLKEILAHHFYHQYKIYIHVTWNWATAGFKLSFFTNDFITNSKLSFTRVCGCSKSTDKIFNLFNHC